MKRTLTLILPLLLIVFLSACGQESSQSSNTESDQEVQIVQVTADASGYHPGSVTLREGVPARLVFTRTVESSCLEKVQIPAFGVKATDLPLNEPVAIEFTPDKSGEFTFACGMNMQTGTLMIES